MHRVFCSIVIIRRPLDEPICQGVKVEQAAALLLQHVDDQGPMNTTDALYINEIPFAPLLLTSFESRQA